MRGRVISEFRQLGRVDLACRRAGIDRATHYRWMQSDPKYAADFEAARPEVAGLLEDEAMRRAVEGVEKPVSIGGKREIVREYDSRLLELLLVKRHPAFREVSGPAPGTTIQVLVQHAGAPMAAQVEKTQIVEASADTAIVRVQQS
jgi:hypothetical protein